MTGSRTRGPARRLIPVISTSSASQGVRVTRTNQGNVADRLWNSAVSDDPHVAHTENPAPQTP